MRSDLPLRRMPRRMHRKLRLQRLVYAATGPPREIAATPSGGPRGRQITTCGVFVSIVVKNL